MNLTNIYKTLQRLKETKSLTVTFIDGDRYKVKDIDFCYSKGLDGFNDYEPMVVDFEKALEPSKKKQQIIDTLYFENPNLTKTQINTSIPSEATYEVEQILSIFDEDKQYNIYDKS